MSGDELKLVLMALSLNLEVSKGSISPACFGQSGFSALGTTGMCVAPVTTMSWPEASKYCQSLGARIVIIDTQEKATAMNTYIKTEFPSALYIWIGGVSYSSLSSSTHRFYKTWVWTDCRAISGTYHSWAPGEPSGIVDKCAVIQLSDFQWNDGPCSYPLNSVCEKVNSRPMYEIIDNTDDNCPSSDQTSTTTGSTTTTTTPTSTTSTTTMSTTTPKTTPPPTTISTTTTTTTTSTTTTTTTNPTTTTTTTTSTTTTSTTTTATITTSTATTSTTTTTPTTTSTITTPTTTTSTTTTLATTTPTTNPTTTHSTTTTPTTTALATTTPATTLTTATSATTAPPIPSSTTTSNPTQISTTPSTSSTPTTKSATSSSTTSTPAYSGTVETTSASTSELTKTTHISSSVTTQKQTTSFNPNPPRTIQTACTCFCKSKDRLEVITEKNVNEKQEQLKRQLVVDKNELSQTIARYTSATDRRPSSSGIGVTCLAIILIPFGLMVISDIAVACQILINKY